MVGIGHDVRMDRPFFLVVEGHVVRNGISAPDRMPPISDAERICSCDHDFEPEGAFIRDPVERSAVTAVGRTLCRHQTSSSSNRSISVSPESAKFDLRRDCSRRPSHHCPHPRWISMPSTPSDVGKTPQTPGRSNATTALPRTRVRYRPALRGRHAHSQPRPFFLGVRLDARGLVPQWSYRVPRRDLFS